MVVVVEVVRGRTRYCACRPKERARSLVFPPRSKQILSFSLFPSPHTLSLSLSLSRSDLDRTLTPFLAVEARGDCGIAGSAAVCKRSTTELDREPRNARENTRPRSLGSIGVKRTQQLCQTHTTRTVLLRTGDTEREGGLSLIHISEPTRPP